MCYRPNLKYDGGFGIALYIYILNSILGWCGSFTIRLQRRPAQGYTQRLSRVNHLTSAPHVLPDSGINKCYCNIMSQFITSSLVISHYKHMIQWLNQLWNLGQMIQSLAYHTPWIISRSNLNMKLFVSSYYLKTGKVIYISNSLSTAGILLAQAIYISIYFPKFLNHSHHDKSGANFSARIAALRESSSRIAKSAVLRYWKTNANQSHAHFVLENSFSRQQRIVNNINKMSHESYRTTSLYAAIHTCNNSSTMSFAFETSHIPYRRSRARLRILRGKDEQKLVKVSSQNNKMIMTFTKKVVARMNHRIDNKNSKRMRKERLTHFSAF